MCLNSLVLLDFIFNLFNYNLLNTKMKKLQGHMKVNFKASCNTPKYTLVVLNKRRVYYKCILKFFVIIIFLSEKISKPRICTSYKGKSGIC